MKLSITFLNNPIPQDSIRIDKKLSCGKFEVFQAYSASQRNSFALKIFPKTQFGTTQYKKEQIISSLSHPNIIKHIPIECQQKDFHVNLTELAKYGDLFELLNDGVLYDNEILIRTYFHQLIEGLEYLHSQEIAHLDLKLENLMLGSEFLLKIIDFDQAQSMKDSRMTSRGTENYRAPEVLSNTCTNLSAADIYSSGIILYILSAYEYPFTETKTLDSEDKTSLSFFANKNDEFWKYKAQKRGDNNHFSKEFKELINGMLNVQVSNRFTIKDIKASKWYKGPILDTKSLKTEIKLRYDAAVREKEKQTESRYGN